MELKYFRLIKTIAEQGNIANSSHQLFLTQSALSHQLRELESQLGFKVFRRTRNNWSLTEEGEELYKTGIQIFDTLERGLTNIKKVQEGSNGRIKVSTECYSFYQDLPAFIQRMGLFYPQVEVDLILEATHQPIPKLLSNEIDIALITAKPENDLLSSFEIFEDEIFAIVHKEHRLANHTFLEASHFGDLHLIIHSFPLETVSVYKEFLLPNKVTPIKISAIPLTEVALEMVRANMGIICMPKWALKSFRISDELRYKRVGKNGLKRTHYLTIRASDSHKKYFKDFISNFQESFVIE